MYYEYRMSDYTDGHNTFEVGYLHTITCVVDLIRYLERNGYGHKLDHIPIDEPIGFRGGWCRITIEEGDIPRTCSNIKCPTRKAS